MLPGAVSSGPSPSGPSPSGRTPTSSMATPANPPSSSPNPRAQHVLEESDVYLAGSSSFSDDGGKPAAADLDAYEEADVETDDDAYESSHQYQAAAADSGVTVGGEEKEAAAESESAESAAVASPEMVVATEDSRDQVPGTDQHRNQSVFQQTHGDAVQSQEAVTRHQHGSGDFAGDRLKAAPGGSGIMDEYLRRMHFSKETPLPSPPQGLPTRASMPRRWSKTNSYYDGKLAVLKR